MSGRRDGMCGVGAGRAFERWPKGNGGEDVARGNEGRRTVTTANTVS